MSISKYSTISSEVPSWSELLMPSRMKNQMFNLGQTFYSVTKDGLHSASLKIEGNLRCRPVKTLDNSVVLEVEVAGIEPKDVTVKVANSTVTVETPSGEANISLGKRLSLHEATASLKHGLLTIKVPIKGSEEVQITVTEE